MLPEILTLVFSAALNWTPAFGALLPSSIPASIASWRNLPAALAASPSFRPAERAVTNWRREAALNLDLPATSAIKLITNGELRGVTRCVKLNNYWCIKRAGWSGEIAADAEGHVAFASAAEGATVAAILLRRYYVDYARHSALAIVSRWAPAQCGGLVASNPRAPGPGRRHSAATAIPRSVAPLGIGNTLRSRWLASHGRGGVLRPVASRKAAPPVRRSVVADRSLRLMPAPEIAIGMGEHEIKLKPLAFAALTLGDPLPSAAASGVTCTADSQRIRNYALRAIEGVASSPDEDLKLFDAEGAPGSNLARVLENMAKVEIGPLAARSGLISAGISQALRQIQLTEAAGKPASAKPVQAKSVP